MDRREDDSSNTTTEVERDRPVVCVFSPSIHVEISIDRGGESGHEIHVHAGGQGYWIARMVATMDGLPWLCAPFGGELGAHVVTALEGLELHGLVPTSSATPARIVDRREHGRGRIVAASTPQPLDRHAIDDLFTRTLGLALECRSCVVAGTSEDRTVPAATFTRLARDLAALGVPVIADVSGDELTALLEGGVQVVKVSDEDMIRDGLAPDGSTRSLVAAAERLQTQGAGSVVITRAESGVLVRDDGRQWVVNGPQLTPVNTRGAGDSLTAALATSLARGAALVDAVRLGVAAGALNATRHGLGSGERQAIEAIAEQVLVEEAE
jgi:1-phosphofructokinase